MKGFWILASVLIMTQATLAGAVQIVTDSSTVVCEEFQLYRELKVYKDPTLFLSNLNLIYTDPASGWESLMYENPLLTTVKGTIRLMRLGPPREFKNFGAIAKIYELAEPRLKPVDKAAERSERDKRDQESRGLAATQTLIVPIKMCGTDSYNDTLGFVLTSDLRQAQTDEHEDLGGLPPSTPSNPIPVLHREAVRGAVATKPLF
jgi:hypothetical protein